MIPASARGFVANVSTTIAATGNCRLAIFRIRWRKPMIGPSAGLFKPGNNRLQNCYEWSCFGSLGETMGTFVTLPRPSFKGKISLEETVKLRRTVRDFLPDPLTLQDLSQLLWAAGGITEARGFKRSAASAGALYPLDLYVLTGPQGVPGLEAGVYHYQPQGHRLTLIKSGEFRKDMARASLSQMWMARAPAILVITGEYERCTGKYRHRGIMYTHIEAGHVGQNIFLQAEALGLGAGIVGAFENRGIIEVAGIPADHDPILLMPVGTKAN